MFSEAARFELTRLWLEEIIQLGGADLKPLTFWGGFSSFWVHYFFESNVHLLKGFIGPYDHVEAMFDRL